MTKVKEYAKAVAAFVASAVATVVAYQATGVLPDDPTKAIVAVAGAALWSALVVALSPANKPPTAQHGPRATGDSGQVNGGVIWAIAGILLIIVLLFIVIRLLSNQPVNL